MNQTCPKCDFGTDDKNQALEASAWRALVAHCVSLGMSTEGLGTMLDKIKAFMLASKPPRE